MTHHPHIAVIGCGHMGKSILTGLIQHQYPCDHLCATATRQSTLDSIQTQHPIQLTTDNIAAMASADVILFAVKPQHMQSTLQDCARAIGNRSPLILSVAAGITTDNIQAWLGRSLPTVRAMPNIAASIGYSATALYAPAAVDNSARELAQHIFETVGSITWLDDENLMDVVTALSGSGPAYFFLLMECLEAASVSLGLPEETAHRLCLQTALGAAQMSKVSTLTLPALRESVTSRGGTTAAALSVLEDHHIRHIFKEAIIAATDRAKALAKRMA